MRPRRAMEDNPHHAAAEGDGGQPHPHSVHSPPGSQSEHSPPPSEYSLTTNLYQFMKLKPFYTIVSNLFFNCLFNSLFVALMSSMFLFLVTFSSFTALTIISSGSA